MNSTSSIVRGGQASSCSPEWPHEAPEDRSRNGSAILRAAFPVMIRRSSDGRRCAHVDQAWRRFIGDAAETSVDDAWTSAVHPEDLEDCLDLSVGAFEAQQPVDFEYRARRSDGGVRLLHEHALPVVDADGSLDGFCHVAIDITEIRREVDRLAEETEHAGLLLRESRHRAAGHLQLIISLLRLQAARTPGAMVQDALYCAAGRIETIALSEQQVDRGATGFIRLDDHMQAIAAPFAPVFAARGIELETALAPVEMPNAAAAPLALLLHEVLINVVEHAFPDGRRGKVRLLVTRGDGAVKLLIADDGIGLPDGAEARSDTTSGLGLIRGFVAQLRGELLIDRSDGTAYLISLPPSGRRSGSG